jgi:hypothetical protein
MLAKCKQGELDAVVCATMVMIKESMDEVCDYSSGTSSNARSSPGASNSSSAYSDRDPNGMRWEDHCNVTVTICHNGGSGCERAKQILRQNSINCPALGISGTNGRGYTGRVTYDARAAAATAPSSSNTPNYGAYPRASAPSVPAQSAQSSGQRNQGNAINGVTGESCISAELTPWWEPQLVNDGLDHATRTAVLKNSCDKRIQVTYDMPCSRVSFNFQGRHGVPPGGSNKLPSWHRSWGCNESAFKYTTEVSDH